ncbi:MAG: carbon-nitrogen hydrolase family protein [Crenarchaeota archaeon]|nr:carbon-nitrogen hydrolase family protein [Thermoproteota archaeon]
MEKVKLTLIQLRARKDKEESLRTLKKLIEKAPDGGIIAIPEYSMFDPTGLSAEVINRNAESLEGPWLTMLREQARRKGSCIVATFFEKNQGGKAYNSIALISDEGEIAATYRKTHLFDALGYRESDVFARGEKLFEPVNFCGVKIGIAICFEIRFPEIFRYQVTRGAELIVIPSAWYTGPGKEEQYRFLAQTRAHENTVWIAAPILYGDYFTGRSIVVNPMGVVVSDAGYGEKTVTVDVDLGELGPVREKLPLLELRRPELYD